MIVCFIIAPNCVFSVIGLLGSIFHGTHRCQVCEIVRIQTSINEYIVSSVYENHEPYNVNPYASHIQQDLYAIYTIRYTHCIISSVTQKGINLIHIYMELIYPQLDQNCWLGVLRNFLERLKVEDGTLRCHFHIQLIFQ